MISSFFVPTSQKWHYFVPWLTCLIWWSGVYTHTPWCRSVWEIQQSSQNQILLLWVMGRDTGRGQACWGQTHRTRKNLVNHHFRSAVFKACMSELQHTVKCGGGSQLKKYVYTRWKCHGHKKKHIIHSIYFRIRSGSGLLKDPHMPSWFFLSISAQSCCHKVYIRSYHICDQDKKSDTMYLWNDKIWGRGNHVTCLCFSISSRTSHHTAHWLERSVWELNAMGDRDKFGITVFLWYRWWTRLLISFDS